MRRGAFLAVVLAALPSAAFAQSCPEPLASARRLVLVTASGFDATQATLRRFERASPATAWREVGAAEPALIGKRGTGWSHFFRALAQGGEPIKVDGDKKAPAGFYRIGASFGFYRSDRPGHIPLVEGTVCVDDPASPNYNAITTRAKVGNVKGENMWRVPEYRRGLVVDYPTDGKARAGSCIFFHVRKASGEGTAGCIALAEKQLAELQDFAAPGAILALLPRQAMSRVPGCLPKID